LSLYCLAEKNFGNLLVPSQLSIYKNECFEIEPAVFAVVRRARRDLAAQKVPDHRRVGAGQAGAGTTNTADHGVHGENIL